LGFPLGPPLFGLFPFSRRLSFASFLRASASSGSSSPAAEVILLDVKVNNEAVEMEKFKLTQGLFAKFSMTYQAHL
jgi:hypothetical protein